MLYSFGCIYFLDDEKVKLQNNHVYVYFLLIIQWKKSNEKNKK